LIVSTAKDRHMVAGRRQNRDLAAKAAGREISIDVHQGIEGGEALALLRDMANNCVSRKRPNPPIREEFPADVVGRRALVFIRGQRRVCVCRTHERN
jgi:hypothetical protein